MLLLTYDLHLTSTPFLRYINLNLHYVLPHQVKHQYDAIDKTHLNEIVAISEKTAKQYGQNFFLLSHFYLLPSLILFYSYLFYPQFYYKLFLFLYYLLLTNLSFTFLTFTYMDCIHNFTLYLFHRNLLLPFLIDLLLTSF